MADLRSYINISANTISATGNVTGANISGNIGVANTANTAATVTTNAQPNITSVGTLTSLSVTGNISGNSILPSGTTVTGVNSILGGPTFTPLANTVAGFNSNVNSYTQITLQNKSNGADATTDYVLTADNGSDTINYGDFGIINSGYDANTPTNSLGNIVFAADTYLYAQGNTGNSSQSGGNLAIGTTVPGKNVKIFAGGVTNASIVANIGNTGVTVTGAISANGNITTTAGTFVGNGAGLTNVTVNAAGNIQGTSSNVSLVAGSYTWTFDNAGTLTMPAAGGNEGAEIDFTKAPNSSLSGNTVVMDQYVDRFRFFENGGTNRGVYIDFTQAAASVGTLLNNRVSGLVNAGTFVTMDLIKATVTTSGNRGLSLATTTGTFACNIAGNYATTTPSSGGSAGTLTVTTTASGSVFNWGFFNQGDLATYVLTDTTNSRAYRITVQIGNAYNNNMITIERLI